jgi:hypothetical protein
MCRRKTAWTPSWSYPGWCRSRDNSGCGKKSTKIYPGFEIWVGDARKDNFVDTETEVVPIDIRVWFVDTPQATAME